MKHTFFSVLALTILLFVSCKDKTEPTGINFDITFQANYDGVQMERYKNYFFGNFPIHFESYRLYLSDISLIKEDGSAVVISEAEYLDFTPDGTSDLSATPKITFKNVPEDQYSGIRLGFGVKPNLNSKDPSDFPPGHPLSKELDYWSGWQSYIFMVLDGKADPDGDGNKNLGFSYHCGSDPVYMVYTFNEHIHVAADHPGIGIAFDIRQLLTNPDSTLFDMESDPATSNNVGDVRVASAIMKRYEFATAIKQ
jgi:hypothetical protein